MWILVLQAVAAISFFNIGLFVYLKAPRNPLNISFGWMAVCIGTWAVTGWVWNYQVQHGIFSILPSRFGQAAATLAAGSLLLWAFFFPNRHPRLTRSGSVLQLLVSVGVAAMAFTPWSVSSARLVGNQFVREFGFFYPVFAIYASLSSLASLLVLAGQYRRLTSNLERQKMRYVFLGLLLALPLILFFMFILPALGVQEFFFLGQTALLLFAGFTAYAIVRYRALDITHFTLKSLTRLLPAALSVGVVYVILSLARPWLRTLDDWALTLVQTLGFWVLFLLLLRSQPWVDKLIYRRSYDVSRVLERLSRALIRLRGLADLEQVVGAALRDELGVDRVTLYLRDPSSQLRPASDRGLPEEELEKHRDFFLWLEQGDENVEREQIEIDPAFTEVQTLAGDFLRAADAELVLPLVYDRRLLGALAVGPKRGRAHFDHLDLQLLTILRNDMAIALSNARLFEQAGTLSQELLEMNRSLEKRVADRTADLEAAMVQLRQLDELKSDFITVASHELRTPLTAVKGSISLVLERLEAGLTGNKLRRLLELSDRNLNRLIQLLNDLLDLSKLEGGKMPLQREPVVLQEVCREAAESLKPLVEGKQMALDLDLPGEPVRLDGDQGKLIQVVVNLLHNALKFSPPQTRVTLRLQAGPEEVRCEVTDQGPGVAAEHWSRIFDKFWKPEVPDLAEEQGTGLGLAIARGIVELHGGSIGVESRPGQGATFYFNLPRAGK